MGTSHAIPNGNERRREMTVEELKEWVEQTVSDKQTDSIFHDGTESFVVEHMGRQVMIFTSGEIRYDRDGSVLRCASDFIDAGIDTDEKLLALSNDQDSWVDNNWFEVACVIDGNVEEYGEICHSTTELESSVMNALTNDKMWVAA